MLLTREFFKIFIDKPIAQAKEATRVLICLSCESREEVDGIVAKAIAAGGRAPRPPQDHGFMYSHAFEDLDGHVWDSCGCRRGRDGTPGSYGLTGPITRQGTTRWPRWIAGPSADAARPHRDIIRFTCFMESCNFPCVNTQSFRLPSIES